MVKKTPFRLSILPFVTAVVCTPTWAESSGIDLSDLPSRPLANLDNIPTRPANNYSVTDIQKAKRQLSATEMKDIDSLIKAARDNQNATADRATDTVKDNRKMMGEMPEYKNTDELVDDAVRGALAKSDMTNEKQKPTFNGTNANHSFHDQSTIHTLILLLCQCVTLSNHHHQHSCASTRKQHDRPN